MYWKLRMQPPSAIDGLLSSEDCQLESILDEEGLLDELKTNRSLLDFLTREDNLEQIVSLVTAEPPSDLPENTKYRRAQIAASLFGVDQAPSTTLVDKVASNNVLLEKLWSFLDQNAPLNSLLASFFSRAMHCILQCKTNSMLAFVRNNAGCLDKLLKHIDTSAVMDLLLSFLITCESFHLRSQLVDWFKDACLVERLVAMISIKCDEDKQRNASRALSEMIRVCYDHLARASEVTAAAAHSDPLLQVLESEETLEGLLGNMFEEPLCANVVLRGTSVIQAMLQSQQGCSSEGSPKESSSITHKEAASSVVRRLTKWLPNLHQVLISPPSPSSHSVCTSAGSSVATAAATIPLGAARFTIIQLLMACLQLDVTEFTDEFIALNICGTFLDLFLEYVWNNFLHGQFEQFVTHCMRWRDCQFGAKSLIELLLVDNQFMKRIATAALENEEEQHTAGGRRRGYMGHVISISNTVLAAVTGDSRVADATQQLTEADLAAWNEWTVGPLEAANQKNNAALGGQHPAEEEEACEMEPLPALDDVQQAFLNYQLTQLTSEFAESFGFSDELHTSETERPVTTPFEEITALDFELSTEQESQEPDLFTLCCEARIVHAS
ncbi:serine/threonine-protein phosphatase 6 regulatory subunit 1-like [Sycon ciliatum]|uniref:serine/threonine-protein phosphatase 6 regulatory subunit 1-like n=1 Tax=Sycon ciliatum TaxID=27933 RepID=UPI0020ACA1F8|eukprot:scpid55470/ scgid33118/ Serine/threonine-protein phosphatase 6 regulatory subunit 3; SAPS domain family member 3